MPLCWSLTAFISLAISYFKDRLTSFAICLFKPVHKLWRMGIKVFNVLCVVRYNGFACRVRIVLPAVTEAIWGLVFTDNWLWGYLYWHIYHLQWKFEDLWVKWKWAIWKMGHVLGWEKMSLCEENWTIRHGFKAHLAKGAVRPKRVWGKCFSCESCYLCSVTMLPV